MSKSTLIVGASSNPERYSYLALERLQQHEIAPIYLTGRKEEVIRGVQATKTYPNFAVDTVTLYVSEKNQEEVIQYLSKYPPQRVIFNPGTENPALFNKLQENKVEALEACTLVMLGTGQY